MAKRAVYPGMFDPIHNGHLDVIQRSLRIFDELIVAVVANPSKQPLFTAGERLEMLDEATANLGLGPHLRIVAFDGLLIDLVARERADGLHHRPVIARRRREELADRDAAVRPVQNDAGERPADVDPHPRSRTHEI